MTIEKVYWDTSCFISFISGDHDQEWVRALICKDVMKHARDGRIELYTSVLTIAETIRPREIYVPCAQPDWATLLSQQGSDGSVRFPRAASQFTQIWDYYKRHTLASRTLSEKEATIIRQMFMWRWVRLVDVSPAIADKAAEVSRLYNMKAADAIHVASAFGADMRLDSSLGQRFHENRRAYTILRSKTLVPSYPAFVSKTTHRK